MCTVCGCGHGETRIEGAEAAKSGPGGRVHGPGHHEGHAHGQGHGEGHGSGHRHDHHHHDHHHGHGADHAHSHDSDSGHHDHDAGHGPHHHGPGGDLHYGRGAAGGAVAGMSQARMIQVEQDILSKNNGYAAGNRRYFAERGILALNLVSSPGSGKTTLLVRTIEALAGRLPVCVVEGDQQTTNDADRIRAAGAPAIQINTGKGCHLDAHMVGHAVDHLAPEAGSVLFIENVGNLVCPAAFDLGEAWKVAILSVTEGEDKPLKYPDMFAAAGLMLINKTDLLPHLDFDMEATIANARKVNPAIRVLPVSARTGEGMEAWLAWIEAARAMAMIGSTAVARAAE